MLCAAVKRDDKEDSLHAPEQETQPAKLTEVVRKGLPDVGTIHGSGHFRRTQHIEKSPKNTVAMGRTLPGP